jgi:FkbM family methyltransferase
MKDQTQTHFAQQNDPALKELNIKFKDKKFHLTLRDYSSDIFILKEIFLNECYALPSIVDPRDGIILDIGANIGLASLYLHATFPEAFIYAFEPLDENYSLLEKNVSFEGSKIKPVKMAISDHSGKSLFMHSLDSSNFGGGWISDKGTISINCITLSDFCEVHHINRIRIMKIDCEGSEYAILYSMNKLWLDKIDVIIGEFHGEEALKLLSFLSDYFYIGVNKAYNQPFLIFTAINKLYTSKNSALHQIGKIVDVSGKYFIEVKQTEGPGFALYGPYALYPPGDYHVNFEIIPEDCGQLDDMLDFCAIDVSTDAGKNVISKKHLTIKDSKNIDEMTLTFKLERSSILEFRVFSKGKVDFMLNTQPSVIRIG